MNNDIDTCNLVLGIDEYLEGDCKNKDNEFIQFKKFYQRIYKQTSSNYIDWLIHKPYMGCDNNWNIYIYGHSLDVTDADVLKKLILTDNVNTYIFYHNKEALGNQIANLVKIITEDELIMRTNGSNKTIKFISTEITEILPTPEEIAIAKYT